MRSTDTGGSDAPRRDQVSAAVFEPVATPRSERAPEAEPTEEAAPAHVGPYRVVRRIAVGGMGAVYEAQQDQPQRRVAIKVIRNDLASPRARRRFEDEIEILGRLQHPGIAQIFEAGEAGTSKGDTPYLAMELVEGDTLLEAAENRRFDDRDRVRLILRVCEAVHYAHQRGVVHRDLKPGNIIVQPDGQPKVLDFGIARLAESEQRRATLETSMHEVVGTLAYMSPEQLIGQADATALSDVYGLGVVAYQLLANRLPHDLENSSLAEAIFALRMVPPTPLAAVRPDLPRDLVAVIDCARAIEPDQRYASADAFGADLRRFLDDEPVTARPPSAWTSARRFVRRHRSLVAGVAIGLGALLVGASVATWQAIESARASAEAARRATNVLEIANHLIFDLHDEIQATRATTAVRRAFVTAALPILEELRAAGYTDAAVLESIAGGYERLSLVQFDALGPNLGDRSGAMESWRVALEIRRALFEREPTPAREFDLAKCLLLHGDPAARADARMPQTPDEAWLMSPTVNEARERLDRLAADSPTPERQILQAKALFFAGLIAERGGNTVQGLELITQSRDRVQQLHARTPSIASEAFLAELTFWSAVLMRNLEHDPTDVVSTVQESRDRFDALQMKQPHVLMHRIRSAQSASALAVSAAGDGRADDAKALIETAVQLIRGAVADDPNDQGALRALQVTASKAAESHEILASTAEAGGEMAHHYALARDWYAETIRLFDLRAARGWVGSWEVDDRAAVERQRAECERRAQP